MHVHKGQREPGKWRPRSKEYIFLGYVSDTSKIWRLWDPERRQAIRSANVGFDESIFPGMVLAEKVSVPQTSALERLSEAQVPVLPMPLEDTSPPAMSSATKVPAEPLPSMAEPSANEPTTSLQSRAPVDQSEEDPKDALSDNEENGLEGHSTSPDQASSRDIPSKEDSAGNDGDPEARLSKTTQCQAGLLERPAYRIPVTDLKRSASGRAIRPPKWRTAFPAGLSLDRDFEPNGYDEAISCGSSEHWLEAIREECDSLVESGTFEKVAELPPGKKAIDSKFVFRLKHNHDESLRHKARMVVKGYGQQYGSDYFETFAPVAKMATLRVLLALAAFFDLEIDQMDVITAFQNPYLTEEVYMKIPKGCTIPGLPSGSIVRLIKALYGLKQSAHEWYKDIDGFLRSIGFLRSRYDADLYL